MCLACERRRSGYLTELMHALIPQLFPSHPYVTVAAHFCLRRHLSSPRAWILPLCASSWIPVVCFLQRWKKSYSVWMNWRGIITHLAARSSLTSQLMRKQIIRGIQRNARRYNHLGLSGLSRWAWQHNWIGQLLCILTKRWCFTGELLAFVCDWKEGGKKALQWGRMLSLAR